MSEPTILTAQENGVGHIILNRPLKHNAFDEHIISELTQIIAAFEANSDIKILLLRANGKNFSAGADLEWMKKMVHYSAQANREDAQQLMMLLQTLQACHKPTIALANGITLGGGVGLLACCDIVIAENEAQFAFSEAKLGLVPATIAPYVVNAIGVRQAKYLFLTAKTFTANEAKNIGLIHETTAQDNLLKLGLEIAEMLLKNGPQALLTIKSMLNKFSNYDEKLLQETADLIAEVRISPEAQEGLNAFLEQRKPLWPL